MQVAGSAATTTQQTPVKGGRQRQNDHGAALGAALGLWTTPLGDFLQNLRAAWTKYGGSQRRGGAEQAAARATAPASAAHEKLLGDRAARDAANDAQRSTARARDAQARETHAEVATARHERSAAARDNASTPSHRLSCAGGQTTHSTGQPTAVGLNGGAVPGSTALPGTTPVFAGGARAATQQTAAPAPLAQSAQATRLMMNPGLAPATAPTTTTTSAAKAAAAARPIEAVAVAAGRAASASVGVATARAAATATTKTATTAPTTGESDANIEQIVRWVRTRSDQRHSVTTLRLDPPELGKLTLRLELQGDALRLEVEAATPAARRLLSERADVLRHSLEAAGIRLERVDVRLQETVADQPTADPQAQQQPMSDGHQPAGHHESPGQGGGMGGTESPSASSTLAPVSLETTTPRMDALGVNVWA